MITVAYNVYNFDGYVHRPGEEKGRPAERSPVDQARAVGQALLPYEPDIITTSESRDEETVAALAETVGFDYAFFPSPGQWPGAIATRYPILEAENCPMAGERAEDLFTRHWGRAVLETPGGCLTVHSIHTFAGDHAVRSRELDVLLPRVADDLARGEDVIVQGDLNHHPVDPEYPRWAVARLTDSYARLGGDPAAGGTLLRPDPLRRLDYVFISRGLETRLSEARPLFEGDFRLYADRPDTVSLSDHLPQLARFRE
jgi:endonuclease/exonuclease/phosphatase family metal-dependent hydrolase